MAVAFRAASVTPQLNGTNYSLAVPAATQVNDLMIAVMCVSNGTGGATGTASPAGWFQPFADQNNGSSIGVRFLTKIATSGDLGSTVTFTGAVTDKTMLGILVYSGASGLGECDPTNSASATTHTAPATTALAASGSWVGHVWSEKSTTNGSWAIPTTGGGPIDNVRINQTGSGGGATSLLATDSGAAVTTRAALTATAGLASNAVAITFEILASVVATAPNPPTGVAATGGNGSASVAFTPAVTGGVATSYIVTSNEAGTTPVTVTASPAAFPGLTNGVAVAFAVQAVNSAGTSAASSASAPVTPSALMTPVGFGWGITLIPGTLPPPPPPGSRTVIGVAAGLPLQAQWNATGKLEKLRASRTYDKALPDSYANSNASAISGPDRTVSIHSVKPDHANTINKNLDTTLDSYGKSLPTGLRLAIHHEPENDSYPPITGVAPFDTKYNIWAATVARSASRIKAQNAGVKCGVIFVSGNVPESTKYVNAISAIGYVPDFGGLDGYSGINNGPARTAKTIFKPMFDVLLAAYPGLELVVGEFGQLTSLPKMSAWLTDANSWFNSIGVTVACYFDEAQWTLASADLDTLGKLG